MPRARNCTPRNNLSSVTQANKKKKKHAECAGRKIFARFPRRAAAPLRLLYARISCALLYSSSLIRRRRAFLNLHARYRERLCVSNESCWRMKFNFTGSARAQMHIAGHSFVAARKMQSGRVLCAHVARVRARERERATRLR